MTFTPKSGDVLAPFTTEPGQCFRMVYSPQLQAMHCREPVMWRGRFPGFKGGWVRVESCEEHAGDVVGATRLERPRSPERERTY